MKRKNQIEMRTLELLLYNDRPVVVNMDKFMYAMTQHNPDTDEEFTRVTLEGGVDIDVQEKMHELTAKLIN